MSFFYFNQLYGQWHVMSLPGVCPNEKDANHQPQEDRVMVKVDPRPKDETQKVTQVVVKIKNKDTKGSEDNKDGKAKDLEEPTKAITPSPTSQTSPLSPTTTTENNPITAHEADNGIALTDTDAEENLENIEYLHLPSQDLEKLKERIKRSSNAKRKFRLWKETMGMCVYCGKHIAALDFVTGVQSDIEHIIPLAIGGTSTFDNLVCSCRKCNRAKGDRTAMDYVLTLNARKQAHYFNLLRLLVSSGSMSEEKYFNLLRPVRLVGFDKNAGSK